MHRTDTSEDIQSVYDRMIRELSGKERFLRGLSLTRFSRDLCLSGIRERKPGLSLIDEKIALFDSIYGGSYSQEEKEKIIQFFRNRA